jgi:hypothetical protein
MLIPSMGFPFTQCTTFLPFWYTYNTGQATTRTASSFVYPLDIDFLKKTSATSTSPLLLLYPVDVLSRHRIPRCHIFLHALREACRLAAR